jgi:hypothetical protein
MSAAVPGCFKHGPTLLKDRSRYLASRVLS